MNMQDSTGLSRQKQNQGGGSPWQKVIEIAKKVLVPADIGYEPAGTAGALVLSPMNATDPKTPRLIPFFALFL